MQSSRAITEKQYRDWNPDQPFLLPPSLQEWLPEDHPVYLMLDILEEIDVSAIDRTYQEKDARGAWPYAPKMMVVPTAVGMQRRDSFFTEAGVSDL